MEFGRAFQFQFKDPDWIKKLVIPGLIILIPIVGSIFILGWMLEITRQVIHREADTLPNLDFSAQLSRGFQAFVISLVYLIPAFILQAPGSMIGPLGAALNLDESTLQTVTMVVSVCCGGLALIYQIAVGFWLPAALGNFVVKGGIGSGFKFAEILALIKAAPVAYLLVLVGGLLAGIISSLGLIACIVGILVTAPFAVSMMGNLYGQAYNQATQPK